MHNKLIISNLALLLLLLIPQLVISQTIIYPENTSANSDLFRDKINRPALSINGFTPDGNYDSRCNK